jgi:hypothetical protein
MDDRIEKENKKEMKNVSLREKICNCYEILVIKEHAGNIALISLLGSIIWIFLWVNDRWSMLSNGITIAFILINITFFPFCFLLCYLLCYLLEIILEKIHLDKYIEYVTIISKIILLITVILIPAEIALVTLKFSFGVVKSKPIVTMGKVLDKKVEERTGTRGPAGVFTITVYLIEVVSEEPEIARFNFTVSSEDYTKISIGDPMKFTYHIESISIFGTSKKRKVLDSVDVYRCISCDKSRFRDIMSIIIGLFPLLYFICMGWFYIACDWDDENVSDISGV